MKPHPNLVTALVLALLAAGHLPSACAGESAPQPYAGIGDTALRAEIMRRQDLLLQRDDSEVRQIVTELPRAEEAYRRLMGNVLGLYKSALTQLALESKELKQIEELRQEHTSLWLEAKAAGLLLTDEQLRLWQQHKSATRVINGVPWEVMTFDPALAEKANDIRRRQWEILRKWDEVAKAYAENQDQDQLKQINQLLDQRYAAAHAYWNQHYARKKRLREIFGAGRHEHLLGTSRHVAWTKFRSSDFVLSAEQLPGIGIELKYPRAFQLPKEFSAPPPPEEFRVLWDGRALLERCLEDEKMAAEAEGELLWFERNRYWLEVYEVVRAILAAPGEPFLDAANKDLSAWEQVTTAYGGFLELMTVDMAEGVWEASKSLTEKALAITADTIFDPGGQIQGLLKFGQETADAMAAVGKDTLLRIPTQDAFPDTPQGRLEYLKALETYQDDAQAIAQALKPINDRWHGCVETAAEALNVFLAGYGIKAGGKLLLEKQANVRARIAEYAEKARLRREANQKANQILEERPGAVEPEVRQKAEEFKKTQDELSKAAEEYADIDADLFEQMEQIERKQAQTEVPPELKESIQEASSRHKSDYTSPEGPPPDGTGILFTEGTKFFETKGYIGGGEFGKVFDLGDGRVIKTFYERTDGMLTDPMANMQREAAGARLIEEAGIHVAEIIESGKLADGTPYMVKELIPRESILTNYLKANDCALPAGHQQALLDLVAKMANNKVFAGDLNTANIYFREVGGVVEAAMLEADFMKTKPNMSAHEVMEAQLNVLTDTSGHNVLAKGILEQEFPEFPGLSGSAGPFANILDAKAVDLFCKRHGIRCDADALLQSGDVLAKELCKTDIKPKKRRGAGATEPLAIEKVPEALSELDKLGEGFKLTSEDWASFDIEEMLKQEKPSDTPIGPVAPPDQPEVEGNPQ